MKHLFLLLVFLTFGSSLNLFADDQNQAETKPDSTQEDKVQILPDDDFDFDFNFDNITTNTSEWQRYEERPYVLLSAGQSKIKDEDYKVPNFKSNEDFTLALGHYKRKDHLKSIITKTDASEFFISNISDKILNPDKNSTDYQTEVWRFGFNEIDGYGYKFLDWLGMNFSHSEGLSWSWMKFYPNNFFVPAGTTDTVNFDTFNESIRFGEQFESIVSLELFQKLALNASYERINIYPRHMFWYWTLGKIIEAGGQGLLDSFVKEIRKYSPEFTPIFNFLLKSGLSYGIYELRRKNMNWPVNTAPPFTYENFKVGLAFNF